MASESPYLVAGGYGALAALITLLGGWLVRPRERGAPWAATSYLVPVAAGFLLALGGLGALPEALEHWDSPWIPCTVAFGVAALTLVIHRLGHAGHDHDEDHQDHGQAPGLSLHDARMAVGGLALHAFVDGVVLGAAFVGGGLGYLAVFAVLLHKLPEGATAAAITYAGGGDRGQARRGVIVVALASLVGAVTISALQPMLPYAQPLVAGFTIGIGLGIAGHLKRGPLLRPALGLLLGVLLFVATEYLLLG